MVDAVAFDVEHGFMFCRHLGDSLTLGN
jgi:hypothetical protein